MIGEHNLQLASAGACRSACLTVELASPAPWYVPVRLQAPEPAGISIPAVSPASVALRLHVRQSGACIDGIKLWVSMLEPKFQRNS